MKVLIITGGNSSERLISLRSAKQVQAALIKNGHRITLFDLKRGYSTLNKLVEQYEVVFPVLHGKDGEDGSLYKFLCSQKTPYVGSKPNGAKIAFDKILFKRYCARHKLPTAKWRVVKTVNDIQEFGLPCVLKASQGGSSKEVIILQSPKDLNRVAVKSLLELNDRFYIEQLLIGVEITVGVLHGKSLPVIEIIPPENKWFDYRNKYSGLTQEIIGAPSISRSVADKAQQLSEIIHRDLYLGPYSRTDFIVVNGTPVILEVNTPGGVGLTAQSLFPKAAQAAGISFIELVDQLIRLAKPSASSS